MTALDQLRRIVALRAEFASVLNERGQRLLEQTLFARYLDCRAAGQEREALRVLEGTR